MALPVKTPGEALEFTPHPGTPSIRVDPVWKEKLRDLAQAMGTTTSEVVRRLVEEAHARLRQERRRQAAARIAAASLPVPDDPRELCRELEEAHGAGAC